MGATYILRDEYHELAVRTDYKTVTYRWDDEPFYYEAELRSADAYDRLTKRIGKIRKENMEDKLASWDMIDDFLESDEMYEFIIPGTSYMHCEPRSEDEIEEYLQEACDKVWLMRNCHISTQEPAKPINEAHRKAIERIFKTYSDIPKHGYSDWECGYWNGILGALRWVLQDEKDFLDM